MIKTVMRLGDDQVMVFDACGEELPEYQGDYEQVKAAIMAAATPQTLFLHWCDEAGEPRPVSREDW